VESEESAAPSGCTLSNFIRGTQALPLKIESMVEIYLTLTFAVR
jgi:hypothetical protein